MPSHKFETPAAIVCEHEEVPEWTSDLQPPRCRQNPPETLLRDGKTQDRPSKFLVPANKFGSPRSGKWDFTKTVINHAACSLQNVDKPSPDSCRLSVSP